MKQVKPSANGLSHSGQSLNDSHLQAGHRPLGPAQVKAIKAKHGKKAQNNKNAMTEASEGPEPTDGFDPDGM